MKLQTKSLLDILEDNINNYTHTINDDTNNQNKRIVGCINKLVNMDDFEDEHSTNLLQKLKSIDSNNITKEIENGNISDIVNQLKVH